MCLQLIQAQAHGVWGKGRKAERHGDILQRRISLGFAMADMKS